jgi:hypothetical protein
MSELRCNETLAARCSLYPINNGFAAFKRPAMLTSIKQEKFMLLALIAAIAA